MTGYPDSRLDRALDWCQRVLETSVTAAPAASDASSRRYFRITRVGSDPYRPVQENGHVTSYILMDAPGQGDSTAAFVRIGWMMRQAGLNTPRIIAADYRNGFLLLTDLGQLTYLDALTEQGQSPEPLFSAAITALIDWQLSSRPARLPEFSARLLRAELDLFTNWYLEHHCALNLSVSAKSEIDGLFDCIVEQLISQPQVYVHRDFMPRNLMISQPLPGVLDYQDAVTGPASYDPVCLYRDAFLSWPIDFVREGLYAYWRQARQAGVPLDDSFDKFWIDCQWTSLQRHFKVIGIFARLFYRDGKTSYLRDVPRFFGYLRSAAESLECREKVDFILQLANKSGEQT
ncbi:phosphotransferase [Halorhodospira halochloris]|uniref:aminoglycoside phosphotransferase family protein n=1 Tax=Halorhodospira halochloris TaxID=1052 RepID=UPI001EE8CD9C|nr:phosphotransferase [Halorhodospira halochloris]MCG5529353.1 phosphotransferase [Halorhodospira halochloris]